MRAHLHLSPQVDYQLGRTFDVPVSVLDISRARCQLGWSPRLTFAEGCARMVNDLRRADTLFSTLLD